MRIFAYFGLILLALLWSCRSEIPFDPDPMDPDPMDTTQVNPGDTVNTTPIDSSGLPGDSSAIDSMQTPCDTAIIYFDSDILPILIGNCAISGCHDAVSAQEGLVLTTYESLRSYEKAVTPFDLDKSELYEKITEDKLSDRMPPAPNEALTQGQILKFKKWILQGAQNNSCTDQASSSCDTVTVSFANDVKPIFETYCITCHGSTNPNGGVSLNSYNGVSAVAKTGKLLGVVKWSNGFLMMPLGGSQIPDCDINTLAAWINQGLINN